MVMIKMKKFKLYSRLRTWLNDTTIQDPVNRQMAVPLQVILIGFLAILLIAAILNIMIATEIPWHSILIRTALFMLLIGAPLVLLRYGWFRSSAIFIIAIFFVLESMAVTSSPSLRTIAETLSIFTLAIILAGFLISQGAMTIMFILSIAIVTFGAVQTQEPDLREDNLIIAINFILLNGLMSLFLGRFGVILRNALRTALERESELKIEIQVRKQAEEALEKSNERLAILHEIDRSILSAHTPYEIALGALIRIRTLITCPRASVTLFDMANKEARFLAADYDGKVDDIPESPITFEEFGQHVIDKLIQNEPWSTDEITLESYATQLDKLLANEYGIHAWLSLPLMVHGQLIGALNLGHGRGKSFSGKDIEITHDIANQLAIAIQQANLYDTLENELAKRKKLITQLEANNAELERFTYTVSHDLKSPIITIRGFVGSLKKDILEHREDRALHDIERIENAADKMQALLSDLLELSRIGRIINTPVEIDFTKLTQDALEMVSERIRSKNITIKISSDLPVVFGDYTRIREVMENLIDNAAKYMGEQPSPLIEIGKRESETETIIYIKDNGMGIEPQFHTRIFGLFEKLNPVIEGTGIGLALIKRIIEVHGGRIWVESEGTGKGSTFCFTLPNGQ